MDDKRWKQISRLFHAAREMDPGDRSAFLEAECGPDSELYEEVRDLLTGDRKAESLLGRVVADAASQLEESMEGRRVGAYRILRELGRGGMGRVFLAERADGQFDQKVALKSIRRGMDSEQIVLRFRQERQILARLHHPNIARLIDGGMTEDGQLFFALEFVKGEAINQYCEQNGVSIHARLRFFLAVCDALVYAHSNLVIHRDLKPDNILVNADGEVRLLDFGIAKVLTEDADETPLTRTGLWIMTPAYASPEQVRGEPIGTASDVYSLGVILYELLTGVRPYEIEGRSPTEVEAVICGVDPEKPSTRVGKRATTARGADDLSRRRKHLAGDLDVICLKALQKEPARRYGSVEALQEDLRRHLNGLPVLARPDTVMYRVGKAVRRKRLVTAAALAVIVSSSFLVTFYTMRLAEQRTGRKSRPRRPTQLWASCAVSLPSPIRPSR